MRRVTRIGTALFVVVGLGLGIAPGLLSVADCATRTACPMMRDAKPMSGHCQPTDALVADCCAGREQPGESARVSLAAPGSKAPGLSAVADAASADQPSPVPSAARPPALDGKLHSIGRHTLFQSFLA